MSHHFALKSTGKSSTNLAKPRNRLISVADPGCLSRIPDPKQQQKRGVKIFFLLYTFFVVLNFTKLYIILFLKCWIRIRNTEVNAQFL